MKLTVEGHLNVYDVTVSRGSYLIIERTTNRKWDTSALCLSDEDAASTAIALIDSVDGPVNVSSDFPAFLRKVLNRMNAA
jgi:hypothetical protein